MIRIFLIGCLVLHGTTFSIADDWQHWRGRDRNDIANENSGWSGTEWPLEESWKINVGEGSTTPIVVGKRLFTLGWTDGKDTVVCLDVTNGKTIWSQSYTAPRFGRHAEGDKGLYFGPIPSPEYDQETGVLYTLNCGGDLNCWKAADGEIVWRRNLYDDYGMPQRPGKGKRHIGRRDYGYTTAPLVYGDVLIVEVGAPSGSVRAFDKRTGQSRWSSECKQLAGHSGSPVVMEVEGVPCLVVFAHAELVIMRLDEGHQGKTIATYPWKSYWANNILTPAVVGEHVLISSFHSHGRKFTPSTCKLRITLTGAQRIWEQPIGSHICSPIIQGNHIYMAGPRLYCLDWTTGKTLWEGANFNYGASCLLTTDGRLVVSGNRGELILAESAERFPTSYKELDSKRVLAGKDVWSHVVLADSRYYVKDVEGNLVCLSIAR